MRPASTPPVGPLSAAPRGPAPYAAPHRATSGPGTLAVRLGSETVPPDEDGTLQVVAAPVLAARKVEGTYTFDVLDLSVSVASLGSEGLPPGDYLAAPLPGTGIYVLLGGAGGGYEGPEYYGGVTVDAIASGAVGTVNVQTGPGTFSEKEAVNIVGFSLPSGQAVDVRKDPGGAWTIHWTNVCSLP